MKHIQFLHTHPVFTGQEFMEYLSARTHGKVGERTGETLLNYYRRTGRIVNIRRGLYAVIPLGAKSDSYPVDLFLIAAKPTLDAVLSHHTALDLFGHSYSTWNLFTYSAIRPATPFTFRSVVFKGTRFPKALIVAGKRNFGVSIVERAGVEIRVTSPERTLVDVLDRPDLSGSWEEIWRSLESIEVLDLSKVIEYALLLGNETTAAKVGFFLDRHRESLVVEDRHLEALCAMRPRQPHYIERARRAHGRLVGEWNLVVPEEVYEEAWREVA